jgi:hypothetical protein
MPWESAVPSDSHKQPGLPARCDLCGREAAPAKPYTLLSRVVTRPEKTISLAPPETASLTSDTKFKAHDFAVCSRCHGRKNVYLIISLQGRGLLPSLRGPVGCGNQDMRYVPDADPRCHESR